MTRPLGRAVFLDRDGVLNRAIVVDGKPFPPRKIDELDIPPDAIEGCRLLRDAGFMLVCVTNQPDVARGLMGKSDLNAINDSVHSTLGLDDLRVCPHSDIDDCTCRKPKPGLLLDGAGAHGIDIAASYMVGDRWRDIDAGLAAGCKCVFIDRGYAEKRPQGMHFTCGTLTEAAHFIIQDHRESGD